MARGQVSFILCFGVVVLREKETLESSAGDVTPPKRGKNVVIIPPSPPPLLHASASWHS